MLFDIWTTRAELPPQSMLLCWVRAPCATAAETSTTFAVPIASRATSCTSHYFCRAHSIHTRSFDVDCQATRQGGGLHEIFQRTISRRHHSCCSQQHQSSSPLSLAFATCTGQRLAVVCRHLHGPLVGLLFLPSATLGLRNGGTCVGEHSQLCFNGHAADSNTGNRMSPQQHTRRAHW